MNNTINTSVSFKATLKTPLKSGVMRKVETEFSNITKNIKGTLIFQHAHSEPISSGLKEFSYNDIHYVTRAANKYLEMDPNNISDREIKKIAQNFADVLNALRIEGNFNAKIDNLEIKLDKLQVQLNEMLFKKKQAEYYKLDGLAEIYADNVQKIQNSIKVAKEEFESKKSTLTKSMFEKVDIYRGHEILDEYVNFLNIYY